MLVPVIQQTTLRMLQLAQQYQAAAGERKRDNQQQGPLASREMRGHGETIAVTLLRAQLMVLMQLVSVPWPETEALQSIFQTLYMSSEVTTAALQLLVGACEELQVRYKDMARQQQLMKRKKKQQSGQQVALNPLLLKLTVPADHVNVGVPPGWEEGAARDPVGFKSSHTRDMSPQAEFCRLAEFIIDRQLTSHVTDLPLVTTVQLKPSRDMGAANSRLCRVEVMKLLLEAALLLQGTEPEAGVHYGLQNVLNVLLVKASKEDALALLRERGGLLMQAATLSTAEEGFELQWQQWQQWLKRQQDDGTRDTSSILPFDWLNTLGVIAGQIGELSSLSHIVDNAFFAILLMHVHCVWNVSFLVALNKTLENLHQ